MLGYRTYSAFTLPYLIQTKTIAQATLEAEMAAADATDL